MNPKRKERKILWRDIQWWKNDIWQGRGGSLNSSFRLSTWWICKKEITKGVCLPSKSVSSLVAQVQSPQASLFRSIPSDRKHLWKSSSTRCATSSSTNPYAGDKVSVCWTGVCVQIRSQFQLSHCIYYWEFYTVHLLFCPPQSSQEVILLNLQGFVSIPAHLVTLMACIILLYLGGTPITTPSPTCQLNNNK